MTDKFKRHLDLKQEISIHFFICISAFMLNFNIYFWHRYKTINKNERKKGLNLIEKLIYIVYVNIKAIKTVILEMEKT